MICSQVLGLAGLLAAAANVHAHHGWGAYDTNKPLYLEGTVAEVRWRDPHPDVVLQVAATPGAPLKGRVPVSPELEALGFRDVLNRAQAPAASGRFTLNLAPIGRLASWGLKAAPKPGERLVVVGFPSCTSAQTVRPALVVLADGTAVRQQSVALPPGCSGAPRA